MNNRNIKRTGNCVEGCTYFLGAIAKTFGDGILTTIKHFKCYRLKKSEQICKLTYEMISRKHSIHTFPVKPVSSTVLSTPSNFTLAGLVQGASGQVPEKKKVERVLPECMYVRCMKIALT